MKRGSKIGTFGAVGAWIALSTAVHAPPADAASSPRRSAAESACGVTADARAYGFYYVVQSGHRYWAYGVNGARVPCGDAGLATSCSVSRLDFSPMLLPDAAATTVLADLGRDESAVRLFFAGKVVGDVLEVWEAWRSPDLVPTYATFYGVSHPDEQALVINQWSRASLGTLDFASAPRAGTCFTTPDGTCPDSSLDAVLAQVRIRAGIVVSGTASRGTFRARHYFLQIAVGETQSNDGWSYCAEGQSFCGDHRCTYTPPSCPTTHGRIRGLTDYPNPNPEPTFRDWQTVTGQLTCDDVAPEQ